MSRAEHTMQTAATVDRPAEPTGQRLTRGWWRRLSESPDDVERARRARRWRSLAKQAAIAVVLYALTRTALGSTYRVPSASMVPTLRVGDLVLTDKLTPGLRVPFGAGRLLRFQPWRAGDIVVFDAPRDRNLSYVKRLVGMPGDTVEMREGRLFVNGRRHRGVGNDSLYSDAMSSPADFLWQLKYLGPRPDTAPEYDPTGRTWGPLIVPGGSFFVLGDNRGRSLDSRHWGFVRERELIGRARLVYWRSDSTTTRGRPRWIPLFALPTTAVP